MPISFSIARERCSTLSDSSLHEEIRSHTGSDEETASILRSLRRFGGDLSIRSFEVTQNPGKRSRQAISALSWNVRAVR